MKNVIITGANSGLGFETAKKIAAKPDYKVILACRNTEKAEAARKRIIDETGNSNTKTGKLDTSSLASVREFAKGITESGEKIYALVNNAGISSMGNGGFTEEGFGLVFATNYLGHFLLTQLLLPVMEDNGRILNVSSDMHNPPGGLTWSGAESIAHPEEDDRKSYSYSKLCMIYMTHELDQRLKAEGKHITINSFNPGYMGDTNFMKAGKFGDLFVKLTMKDRYGNLSTSADALAKLVTEDLFANVSGEYFDRSTETARSSELSYNSDHAKELWSVSMRYTGLS